MTRLNAEKSYKAYLANGNKVAAADILKKYPDFAEQPKPKKGVKSNATKRN